MCLRSHQPLNVLAEQPATRCAHRVINLYMCTLQLLALATWIDDSVQFCKPNVAAQHLSCQHEEMVQLKSAAASWVGRLHCMQNQALT